MFSKYISMTPEFLLLVNVVVMQITHWFRNSQTPKTFSTISKFFLLLSFLSCIIFYNQSVDTKWYTNSVYTTFFKSGMIFCSLLSGLLACKWFLHQNQPSLRYYQLTSLSLLCFCIAISSNSLLLLYISLSLALLFAFPLLSLTYDINIKQQAFKIYLVHYIVFFVIFSIAVTIFYTQVSDISYTSIREYYKFQNNIWTHIGAGCVFISLMYILGVFPCNRLLNQIVGFSILPASAFFSIIPIWSGIAVLITLFHNVFYGIDNYLQNILVICGIFSVISGVIGSNSKTNIRQLFSCVGTFNLGIILLILSQFSQSSLQSGIIYLLVYIISIFGIYTCFYGIRYHGEYIQHIDLLSGMSSIKPYISSALLFFTISFLGVPPLLGMLGNLSMINNFLSQERYFLISFIFFMLAWFSHGMLRIIKIVFFDKKNHNFDRADKGVYLLLMINIVLMLAIVIKPRYLISDIETITRLFLVQVQ